MTTAANPFAPVLSADELAVLLAEQADVRLLDVRTPGEFESAHIRGAYNVPLNTLDEHAAEIRASVRSGLVLICQSGQRAHRAEKALKKAGMPNLHVLDGGMNAWLAAGKPVERGPARLSLERQVRIAAGALAATGGFLAVAVNPRFGILSAFIGSGLVFAGVTNICGMALLLARLPYNRPAACDVEAMVQALKTGQAPTGIGRAPAIDPTVRSCAR